MLVKTVLNRVHKVKGFVYEKARFHGDRIEVEIRPRKGSRPICSGCGRRGPGYDTLEPRRFTFVPLWGIAVYLIYAKRRVDCFRCGVTVEQVPWARGKHHLTQAYAVFLARWARRLSWREVSLIFKTSWENVYRSVAWVVEYGLKHRSLDGITAIGVDEVQFRKGHRYLTVVYQIDQGCRRLLWIGKDRTTKTLLRFFRMMGRERTAVLRFVCSDMWQPYLKVIAKKASQALHILDRFHIVAKLNQAIDEVRAAEAKELSAKGYEPVLKHSRWCFLKRVANLTNRQSARLADLMCYSLKTVRAYLLKESFQALWEYKSYHWAGVFLDGWLKRAMRSRLQPIKKVARSIRAHKHLILNWFAAKKEFNSGIVEGLNYRIKLTIRKAYGFRTLEAAETALYHAYHALITPWDAYPSRNEPTNSAEEALLKTPSQVRKPLRCGTDSVKSTADDISARHRQRLRLYARLRGHRPCKGNRSCLQLERLAATPHSCTLAGGWLADRAGTGPTRWRTLCRPGIGTSREHSI